MKIAVIDLGTNTFNLLIAENDGAGSFKILQSSKIAVKLAKGSLEKKELKTDAITRGLNAIEKFNQAIKVSEVNSVYACATAAIRNSKNGSHFVKSVKERFNIDVSVIEGDREAELIFKGVRQTLDPDDRKYIIIDIGGGSIEFVIANRQQIFWKKSYPIGMAYLLEKFKPSDPLSIEEIEIITNFFEEKLAEVFDEVKKHEIDTLVGASGAFESFSAMIKNEEKFESEVALQPGSYPIDLMDFDDLSWKLVSSTLKERKKMKGLEAMRIEFIVLAALFVKFFLDKTKIKTFIQSNFSLKEGLMSELIQTA
ncbi:MAG: hypothetical protein JXB00_13495 [Bacteroidales bacterium]|nr:hypothetical protein [Bacteroidales bacterium]